MSNVHTLKDIKNRGHRLGSAYEQELEKKLRTAIDFNSEITDFNEKLQAEISEYSEREEEFQRSYADIVNKTSQLNASSTKVRSQLISERKSHSESQQRGATLAQKASSADKVQILFLETKIRELEGKLEDIDLERTYHDLDAMGGKLAQISSSNPKEIDSLRLELEQ
ncbi:2513_t:CDS:2, partial [Rhizophagus irregularis]